MILRATEQEAHDLEPLAISVLTLPLCFGAARLFRVAACATSPDRLLSIDTLLHDWKRTFCEILRGVRTLRI